jgi:hypothetical protein
MENIRSIRNPDTVRIGLSSSKIIISIMLNQGKANPSCSSQELGVLTGTGIGSFLFSQNIIGFWLWITSV